MQKDVQAYSHGCPLGLLAASVHGVAPPANRDLQAYSYGCHGVVIDPMVATPLEVVKRIYYSGCGPSFSHTWHPGSKLQGCLSS